MSASHVLHLAQRFFGSLVPGGPSTDDDAWARSWLLGGEAPLWERMSGADRRHAVGVAREVVASLGETAVTRPVVAAALLHDVGKVESGLGTFGRVLATLWRGAPLARVRAYNDHPDRGGALLARAGSDELTIHWAEDHHKPPSKWRVPREMAQALKAADDD